MPKVKIPKKFLAIGLAVILFSLLIFTSVFLGSKSARKPAPEPDSLNTNYQSQTSPQNDITRFTYNPPEKIIAKVGEENIYQKDFDTEMSYYPLDSTNSAEIIMNKLVTDSKILQIAQKQNFIPKDEKTYNSLDKNYMERIGEVQKAKEEISKSAKHIEGTVVAVWFLNDRLVSYPYEQARQLALEKITLLQNSVKSGILSIEQAAEKISNDSSLAKLDPSYRTNSSYDFAVSASQPISRIKDFDSELWQLTPGEVSNIHTGQSGDVDDNMKLKDAYYIFGVVKIKNENSYISDPAQWIKDESQKYEVKYF